ncbi:MAG: amidase family protein [Acidobacteriota bacterium]
MTELRILFVVVLLLATGCAAPPPADEASPASQDVVGDAEPAFPLAEPTYTSKRPRDLSPLVDALDALGATRLSELESRLATATIPEIQAAMDAGALSSEELVLHYVDRIKRYDVDKLNAVLELNPEALEIARARDAERADGTRGPLHGIPVLLKDNIATSDRMHTAAGALALRDWRPARDAFLVTQLRAAGAVILGKANLSEWANYLDPDLPNGFSALGGQTRHPHGAFDPLGSSSGSAVAVAARLATVSVGTETQGSIIRPAEVNGIVGLKTSMGAWSRDMIVPLVEWMDVPGPMGRTVTDVAFLFAAGMGVDANDPVTDAAEELDGLDVSQLLDREAARQRRVGVVTYGEAFFAALAEDAPAPPEGLDEDELASYRRWQSYYEAYDRQARQALEVLRELQIDTVAIDWRERPQSPNPSAALRVGFRAALDPFLARVDAPFDSMAAIVAYNNEDPANRIPFGQDFLAASAEADLDDPDYAKAREENPRIAREHLDRLFDTYDIDVLIAGSQVYAAAGYPALAVPSGLADDGEPRGLVMIGRFLGEPDLLAVGYAYEQATRARVEPDLDAVTASFP